MTESAVVAPAPARYDESRRPVTDGFSLAVRSWPGPVLDGVGVVAVHGITANRTSFQPLADALGGEVLLAAPDLRGRGRSDKPAAAEDYGMVRHADDIAALIGGLGLERAVLVGHSMGAWVALQVAARHPELVHALVLVDGGYADDLPPGVSAEQVLEAVLAPVLARLRVQWPSREAVRDFWRAVPAFAGADWTHYVEAYADEDLGDDLRARCTEVAPRADHASMLAPHIKADLAAVRCPVHLLRAPAGFMLDPATDVPLLPDRIVEGFRARVPQLTDEVVPEVNHYTIGLSARGGAAIAAAVRKVLP